MILPDRITIFQKPIEAICRSEKEVVVEVRRVVQHEIAHHFGLDDNLLKTIESDKRRRGRRPGL
jgi:predicted Zn-dependent protease with MMP-like domain